jgi:hypothetical protein
MFCQKKKKIKKIVINIMLSVMNIQLKQIFAKYMIKKICKNVERSLSNVK